MQRLLLNLLFLPCALAGHGQAVDPVFRHITRSSGLPVNAVSCIAQDSSGFMWIGTTEGLFKYDGFTFKGFYNEPGNLQTIPGNYILQIHVDSKGFIWIVTNRSGLAVLSSNGTVLQVINSSTLPAAFSALNDPYSLKEDRQGCFWCGTANGLFKLQRNGDKAKVIKRLDLTLYRHPTNNTGALAIDEEGKLWLGTFKGLVVYDPAKDVLYNATNNPKGLPFLKDTAVSCLIHLDENNGLVCYSTWEPATRIYNAKTKIITTVYTGKGRAVPDFGRIGHFFTDSHRNLWMMTWKDGLNLYADGTKKRIRHQADDPYSLLSNDVKDVCEDREGNIWFATTEGISITRPYHQPFINLSANNEKGWPFAKESVSRIIPVDSNTLLIGTYNGLYEADKGFKKSKHFVFGSVAYDWIWTYFKDEARRKIYISTQEGMLLYDEKTHTVKKLTGPPFGERRAVSSFVADHKGGFWFSHFRNDFVNYNPATGACKKYKLADLGEKPSILSLFKDGDGNLWIVHQEAGLLRFDEKQGRIVERITVNPGVRNGLLQANVMTVKDLGNEFFIGYITKGFSLYNKAAKTFRHFSQADGLISNGMVEAAQARDGSLWIATTNGLVWFDAVKKEFVNYGYSSGILQNYFECIAQLPDGRIAAGTNLGLVVFHPDSLTVRKPALPPPVITELSVYGRKLTADSLCANRLPLNVSYKENYFAVEYISLLYQNSQQVEYAYKLEGLDKDWISAGNRRFVSYAHLKGNTYAFRVKARLPGGAWTEGKTPLFVVVHPPFYTRWWFYLLCALLVTLFVYGLFRYRLRQLLRLEKLRTSISSDLHDEVGATLSSISIFSEMAKKSVAASSGAQTYLQRIGDRSRDGIEKMSDIIWSINPENDTLQQILVRMKTYAAEVAEAKDMRVHWTEGENITGLRLGMAERKNFYLLFKEAVNNAAKYSGGKTIRITLNTEHKRINLEIRDDGVGFTVTASSTGNGLKNIHRRAALLHGNLTIESFPGSGTAVVFSFPC